MFSVVLASSVDIWPTGSDVGGDVDDIGVTHAVVVVLGKEVWAGFGTNALWRAIICVGGIMIVGFRGFSRPPAEAGRFTEFEGKLRNIISMMRRKRDVRNKGYCIL